MDAGKGGRECPVGGRTAKGGQGREAKQAEAHQWMPKRERRVRWPRREAQAAAVRVGERLLQQDPTKRTKWTERTERTVPMVPSGARLTRSYRGGEMRGCRGGDPSADLIFVARARQPCRQKRGLRAHQVGL